MLCIVINILYVFFVEQSKSFCCQLFALLLLATFDGEVRSLNPRTNEWPQLFLLVMQLQNTGENFEFQSSISSFMYCDILTMYNYIRIYSNTTKCPKGDILRVSESGRKNTYRPHAQTRFQPACGKAVLELTPHRDNGIQHRASHCDVQVMLSTILINMCI